MTTGQDNTTTAPPEAERPVPDLDLVRRLVRDQFPQWAALSLRPVEPQGCDNRTFRLGTDLAVRIPSALGYDPQVEKEHRWLPTLAAALPLPIPRPIAKGRPTPLFPGPWSVYHWHAGCTLNQINTGDVDMPSVATSLGEFLTTLRAAPTKNAPPPGTHNFWRGADFTVYAAEANQALTELAPELRRIGEPCIDRATESFWPATPVWVHGDIAPGNLLVLDGRLSAVIDFGCCAVGDPACDLVAAWTLFDRETRPQFMQAVGLDPDTWNRARGWAVWKAAITLANPGSAPAMRTLAQRTFSALAEDSASADRSPRQHRTG